MRGRAVRIRAPQPTLCSAFSNRGLGAAIGTGVDIDGCFARAELSTYMHAPRDDESGYYTSTARALEYYLSLSVYNLVLNAVLYSFFSRFWCCHKKKVTVVKICGAKEGHQVSSLMLCRGMQGDGTGGPDLCVRAHKRLTTSHLHLVSCLLLLHALYICSVGQ